MKKVKNMMVFFIVLLGVFASATPLLADGMFYVPEKIPPTIPYQRALLLFDNSQEILLLQSKYQTTNSKTNEGIGWVVPTPTVPELASMKVDEATRIFQRLHRVSYPIVFNVMGLLLSSIIIGSGIWLVLVLVLGILSLFLAPLALIKKHSGQMVRYSLYVFLLCLFAALLMPVTGGSSRGGVEVLKEETVGIYDIKVIKSDSSSDLIDWLKLNHFEFTQSDRRVFDDYIKQGWCFTVAKVKTTEENQTNKIVSEGLVAPLILRFKSDEPIYPLALTATSGHNTQVLLYVLSRNKMESDGRLKLRYAGNVPIHWNWKHLDRLPQDVDPPDFFSLTELVSLRFLSKFKGTLTPAKMRNDLKLHVAKDNEPYRGERVIVW